MNKKWITIIGSGILATGIAGAAIGFTNSDKVEITGGSIKVQNQTEGAFPGLAKITMDQADSFALASVPGQILKTGLEDENGFLVYGVEVVTADKTIMEVKVDAGSGKVLAAERDEMDTDRDETDD